MNIEIKTDPLIVRYYNDDELIAMLMSDAGEAVMSKLLRDMYLKAVVSDAYVLWERENPDVSDLVFKQLVEECADSYYHPTELKTNEIPQVLMYCTARIVQWSNARSVSLVHVAAVAARWLDDRTKSGHSTIA